LVEELPAAIHRTALMTVDEERDDDCAAGQIVATQDLCTNILPSMKTYRK
jgi:poly-beta-hydroxyalkanoate depolymerase